MQIIRDIAALRLARRHLVEAKQSLALVPTMGALHAGHMALVAAARQLADQVAVSIFVNPTQFGPGEDYIGYPRCEAQDAEKLASAGVALLWTPPREAVYHPDHRTFVRVTDLGDDYCGATRRGHFDGVALIVAKLFNQIQPDYAIFGEKDWQQLTIIRQMTRDLDFPTRIHAVPIIRESDGLALSSRNAYLSSAQRVAAACFPHALQQAQSEIRAGAVVADVLATARVAILAGGFDAVDYIHLVDANGLGRLNSLRPPARILAAAQIGQARLLDTYPL